MDNREFFKRYLEQMDKEAYVPPEQGGGQPPAGGQGGMPPMGPEGGGAPPMPAGGQGGMPPMGPGGPGGGGEDPVMTLVNLLMEMSDKLDQLVARMDEMEGEGKSKSEGRGEEKEDSPDEIVREGMTEPARQAEASPGGEGGAGMAAMARAAGPQQMPPGAVQ